MADNSKLTVYLLSLKLARSPFKKPCLCLHPVAPLGILLDYFLTSSLGPKGLGHSLSKGGKEAPCLLQMR